MHRIYRDFNALARGNNALDAVDSRFDAPFVHGYDFRVGPVPVHRNGQGLAFAGSHDLGVPAIWGGWSLGVVPKDVEKDALDVCVSPMLVEVGVAGGVFVVPYTLPMGRVFMICGPLMILALLGCEARQSNDFSPISNGRMIKRTPSLATHYHFVHAIGKLFEVNFQKRVWKR